MGKLVGTELHIEMEKTGFGLQKVRLFVMNQKKEEGVVGRFSLIRQECNIEEEKKPYYQVETEKRRMIREQTIIIYA